MQDWTSGYVTDVTYTHGYYPEMNVARLRLTLLANGIPCPNVETACELGYGQGLSANIHAAGTTIRWFGTDFNPAQANMAREMARVSGAAAEFRDDTFAEFCTRADLPDFDFIALHGIWSWISDDNRHVIVDFLRRKLKVGGVLYISYNALPGWSSTAPIRHLLVQHAGLLGPEGLGTIKRVNGAVDFALKLLETKPAFLKTNPAVAERLKQIQSQNRHYLAHEYLNRDWHPMYFATMREWLEPAKLSFACSAHFLDQIDAVNLTPEQQKFLSEIPDETFRESVRDFMTNQPFRRDYWIKGKRKLSFIERNEALRDCKILLQQNSETVPKTMAGVLGVAQMNEQVYNPLLETLGTHEAKSFGHLEAELAPRGVDFAQLVQASMVLLSNGNVAPVQDAELEAAARPQTARLNDWLIKRARADGDISHLVSPVSGGGVMLNRFEQLFLHEMRLGKNNPDDWVNSAWKLLSSQGQKIVKKGETLDTPEQNIAELRQIAMELANKKLSALKALGIV